MYTKADDAVFSIESYSFVKGYIRFKRSVPTSFSLLTACTKVRRGVLEFVQKPQRYSLDQHLLCLRLDTLDTSPNVFLISEVVAVEWSNGIRVLDGLQVFVQFVHERNTGRDVQFGNVFWRNPIEVLHQRPQCVAVGSNKKLLAALDGRYVRLVPVDHEPLFGQFKGLCLGKVFLGNTRVLGVVAGVVFGRFIKFRRGDIIRTTPYQHLVLAVLIDRFLFVEALKGAIMPLVQSPRVDL